MVYSAVLSWQINFVLSVQLIFKCLQNLKRILKELVFCANRDIHFMGACLPLAGGDLVDDRVLVEVGISVVLLGRVVDRPGKRITFSGGRGATGGKANKLKKAIKVFI